MADFHFDSISQIRLDEWSRGRIVLVGDAGYSCALASGQGTTVAMVGAYVLAGELATPNDDLVSGIASYQNILRDYVIRNQDIALQQHAQNTHPQATEPGEGESDAAQGVPDFGALTLPFLFKDYEGQAGLLHPLR